MNKFKLVLGAVFGSLATIIVAICNVTFEDTSVDIQVTDDGIIIRDK